MSYPSLPHFSLPLRLDGSSFAVVEQNSQEEIMQAVEAILRTEPGFRDELPEFGLPDPTFRQGGVSENDVREAIVRWEPRVLAEVESDLDELVNLVNIRLRGTDNA